MANTKVLVILTFLIFITGLALLFLGLNQTSNITTSSPSPSPTAQNIQGEATPSGVLVTEVIDGDTIKIEGNITVRYLGVDTPETKDPRRPVGCFGKEASAKNKELVEDKKVFLEKDVSESDKYNRLLRLVYLPLENGQMLFVNDYLIREGYGKVLTIPPDVKFSEQFLEAQRAAREFRRGLWGSC